MPHSLRYPKQELITSIPPSHQPQGLKRKLLLAVADEGSDIQQSHKRSRAERAMVKNFRMQLIPLIPLTPGAICWECGLKFSGNPRDATSNLRRHLRERHNKNAVFKCPVPGCETTTVSRIDNLKRHIRRHHGSSGAGQAEIEHRFIHGD